MWSRERILQRPLSRLIRRVLRIPKVDQAAVHLGRMANRAHMSHCRQHFMPRERQCGLQHVGQPPGNGDSASAA